MKILCIYRFKSLTHMNSFKLDTEVYIWKKSMKLFISDEKILTFADITELRYLLF